MKFYLNNLEFNITHKISTRSKRVSIALRSKSELLVTSPINLNINELNEIIYKHKKWIIKARHRVCEGNIIDFSQEPNLPYLGKLYSTYLINDEKYNNVYIKLNSDKFEIYYNKKLHTSNNHFLEGIKTFYKYNAQNNIKPLFDKLIKLTSLKPNKIAYRYATRRWGSCSYKNDISINYMLLQFPLEVIEYVVLHEICHIKEKNHSKRFWNLVSTYMRDYKNKEKILKNKILF